MVVQPHNVPRLVVPNRAPVPLPARHMACHLEHGHLGHLSQVVLHCVGCLFRKSREGWNCRFQKTPHTEGGDKVTRKVGTRSRQCRPKVPCRFAFPGARNPRIYSISRSGKHFPAIFPGLSRSFPRTDPGNSHSLLEFPELSDLNRGDFVYRRLKNYQYQH